MSTLQEQATRGVTSPDGRPIWVPLESDPDILTDYLRMLTLTEHYLIDVPVIDGAEEMGIFAGHNVKAFIFLYQINEKIKSEVEDAANQPPAPSDIFHMKQLVRNACGSVALFHAYLNSVDPSLYNPDSIMYKFYHETIDQDSQQRGEAFAKNQNICDLQHQQAAQGQTGVPTGEQLNKIDHHFIAIVGKNGVVYLLEGRTNPIKMGEYGENGFVAAGLEAMKKLMARDPDNYSYSAIALCGN